jgi:DNA-binding transcriptional MerR regulator
MNAAHAIRRLEEAGFSHAQATGVVEVVQGEVIDKLATRDFVGEQIALVRKELAEQIGAVRQELAEQIGAVRREHTEQIGQLRAELLGAINRLTLWMNGFLVALLIAVLSLSGVLIGKL